MSKKLGVVTIHGMGTTERTYASDLRSLLARRLGSDLWSDIHFESIYYQEILQDNERRVWENMITSPEPKLNWINLRKFLLFGFADASSLEHRSDEDNSVYKQAQKAIASSLRKTHEALGNEDKPVILIAQSLGCQVISNYIWDTQKAEGIWDTGSPDYLDPAADETDFLKLKTLRFLLTTGCNIPIFVAGFDEIQPIDSTQMHPQFQWENYYDRDDVLGWPLQPLSDAYHDLVKDVQINAGNIISNWNPASHGNYWSDRDFIKPLLQHIKSLLQ